MSKSEKKTRVERFVFWCQDNKVVSVAIIIGVIISALATFTEDLAKLRDFFHPKETTVVKTPTAQPTPVPTPVVYPKPPINLTRPRLDADEVKLLLSDLSDSAAYQKPFTKELQGVGIITGLFTRTVTTEQTNTDWIIRYVIRMDAVNSNYNATVDINTGAVHYQPVYAGKTTAIYTWTFLLGDIDWRITRTTSFDDNLQQGFHVLNLKCSAGKKKVRYDTESQSELRSAATPATNDRIAEVQILFTDVGQATDIQNRLSKILKPAP